MYKKHITPLFFTLALLFAGTAQAQDAVQMAYELTPKADMVVEFEQALKAHADWRTANNDPWAWTIWAKTIGEGVAYGARTDPHSWEELDAYAAFAAKADAHFRKNVMPYVESVNSRIDGLMESFYRPMDNMENLNAVGITTYRIKPGARPALLATMGKIIKTVNDHDYPSYFGVYDILMGTGVGSIDAISFHENWSDMKEPDGGLVGLLAKAHGEEMAGQLYQDFAASIEGSTHAIWVKRADLSVTASN